MRRRKVLYGVGLLCALVLAMPGIVSANTLVVPFFNDSSAANDPTGGPGVGDFTSFIRLANSDADTVTLTFTYRDFFTGVDTTPSVATYELGATSGVVFRPYQTGTPGLADVTEGGVGSPAELVPDVDHTKGGPFGTLTITYTCPTPPNCLTGMYNSRGTNFSYASSLTEN